MADYKLSLLQAKEKKKQACKDNDSFWKQQVEWRKQREEEMKKEPYDPELVWNIEGPTRKKTD